MNPQQLPVAKHEINHFRGRIAVNKDYPANIPSVYYTNFACH